MEDLRDVYRKTLIKTASEIGSVSRSTRDAVALGRIRRALGVPGQEAEHAIPEAEIREVVLQYVISLRAVLQEMAALDQSATNQAAVRGVEEDLNMALV